MKHLIHILCLTLTAVMLSGFSGPSSLAQTRPAEKAVNFTTEDGWAIAGMYYRPEGKPGRIPAVVFLHSYEHDSDAYGQYLYPGLAQIISARGIATLRFDFRGRGKSAGKKRLHLFTPDELTKLALDVKAAIGFLAAQHDVDPERIGIVAEGTSAEAAVIGWGGDPRIKAMIMLSGRLSDTAKSLLAGNPELPVSLVVSKEDKDSFHDMSDAYKATHSTDSRIAVYKDMGMGTTMFSVWRSEKPKEKPLEEGLSIWMEGLLKSYGDAREVSFKSEDGWTLYGTLQTPEGMSDTKPAPAVVLIHSSFTDRYVWDHLAQLLVRRGLAVLTFDSRGRGKSQGQGDLLSLAPEIRNNTALDAKAAVTFLTAQPSIGRIGLMGADRGATYALAAAIGNPRVGGVVLMTTLVNPKEREEIARMDIPFFYLGSQTIETATSGSMAAAFAASKHGGSKLMVYPGGSLGYDLFEVDPALERELAQWMKDQLSR